MALALVFLSLLWVEIAQACATCGLSRSFTPMMLLISTGFVILPFCFVGVIAWKLWKDSKDQQNLAKIPTPPSETHRA